MELIAVNRNCMSHLLKERFAPFSPTYGALEREYPTKELAVAVREEELAHESGDHSYIHPAFLKHEVRCAVAFTETNSST